MAIELNVFCPETGLGAHVDTIAQGDIVSFVDQSVTPPRLLHFACYPDNGGGAIYAVDPRGDVLDVGSHRYTHASLLNEDSRLHEIPLNGEYELPISRPSLPTVQLIVEHTDEY